MKSFRKSFFMSKSFNASYFYGYAGRLVICERISDGPRFAHGRQSRLPHLPPNAEREQGNQRCSVRHNQVNHKHLFAPCPPIRNSTFFIISQQHTEFAFNASTIFVSKHHEHRVANGPSGPVATCAVSPSRTDSCGPSKPDLSRDHELWYCLVSILESDNISNGCSLTAEAGRIGSDAVTRLRRRAFWTSFTNR